MGTVNNAWVPPSLEEFHESDRINALADAARRKAVIVHVPDEDEVDDEGNIVGNALFGLLKSKGGGGCGTGAGGFKPGNTCGKGGGGAVEGTPKAATDTPEFKAWFGKSKVVDSKGDPKETANIEGIETTLTGKPVVVFHGTPRGEITTFDKSKIANPDHLHFGPGFYFTEDVKAAEGFAQGGHSAQASGSNPTVMSFYLKAEKPFDVDTQKIDPSKLEPGHRTPVRQALVQRAFTEDGREAAREVGAKFDRGELSLHYRDLADAAGVGGLGVSKTAIANLLQSQGYDALTTMAPSVGAPGKNRYWIIFEPTQVKSTRNKGTFDPNDPNTLNVEWYYDEATGNTFCKTGPGGGVDATCGKGAAAAAPHVAPHVTHPHLPEGYRPPTPKSVPNDAAPAASRPKLSTTEAAAAENYSRWHYGPMNKALYGGKPSAADLKEVTPTHKALQSAFAVAKPFDHPVQVQRAMQLDPHTLHAYVSKLQAAHDAGGEVELKGYQSTATGPDNKFKGNVQISIAAVHGLDLKPYSHSPDENELLLNTNSKFKVKSITVKGGVHHIELEQQLPEHHSLGRDAAEKIGAEAKLGAPQVPRKPGKSFFKRLLGG